MKHVCSKENGLRLQELGVTVESYFGWYINGNGKFDLISNDNLISKECLKDKIPAHTVGELLEATKKWGVTIKRWGGTWMASMSHPCTPDRSGFVIGKGDAKPADALALCLCEAIDQKHVDVQEVNRG